MYSIKNILSVDLNHTWWLKWLTKQKNVHKITCSKLKNNKKNIGTAHQQTRTMLFTCDIYYIYLKYLPL